MQGLAVTEAITTIAEAEKRFGLSRSESQDFFTEWHEQLPEINSSDAYGERSYRFWIIVLESKKTMLSVWSALPQTLAYLMASPNSDLPTFGMLTNGDDIVFVKLENQHYAISRVFAPLTTQSELEFACRVLRKIAETLK
jgi:hypothetical protein